MSLRYSHQDAQDNASREPHVHRRVMSAVHPQPATRAFVPNPSCLNPSTAHLPLAFAQRETLVHPQGQDYNFEIDGHDSAGLMVRSDYPLKGQNARNGLSIPYHLSPNLKRLLIYHRDIAMSFQENRLLGRNHKNPLQAHIFSDQRCSPLGLSRFHILT